MANLLKAQPVTTVGHSELDKFNNDMARQSGRGKDFISTQGYLRDDFPLQAVGVNTLSVIPWTLTQLQTGTAQTNCANRLKTDDAFLVMQIGVFIGFTATTAAAESAIQQNQMVLHSFPDALVMAGAGDAASLQQLYNGFVSIKQASTTYFERLEVLQFYRVGVAQQGTLLFTASNQLRSQWEGYDYGFVPVITPFRMAGNKNYDVKLEMNVAAAFTALAGVVGKLYATIRFRGFLATGCANYI